MPNAQLKIWAWAPLSAQNTVTTSSNSSVSSVAPSLNGSAGATPTSVSHVTSDSAPATTFPSKNRVSCPNALEKNCAH